MASSRAQGANFSKMQEGENESEEQALPGNNERRLRAHLFALALASLKAGCCVDSYFQSLHHPHHACFTALQGTHSNLWSKQVHFDSDYFPIVVENHASYCYVNSPHLSGDLVLSNESSVDAISDGLPIKGKGTFNFTIGNINGRRHNISIPKSIYVPGMKKCLLSP